MADDWDLYAVVRSCTSLAATTTTTTATAFTTTTTTNPINGSNIEKDESFPSLNSLTSQNNDNNQFYVPSILDDRNDSFQELDEIYKVFYSNPVTYTTMAANTNINTTTSISVAEEFQDKPQPQWPRQVQPKQQQQQQRQVVQREQNVQFKNAQIFEPSSITLPIASPQPIQPPRRKNQQTKMVRQMTQEELTADSWTWRKYGQKPIKGSSYPRNYYRCSTAKGCAARKQVERSPTDANIYIVSYTGEHTHPRPTHRSSLTGSTQNKSSQANAIKPVSSDHAATSRNNTSLVAASSLTGSPRNKSSQANAIKPVSRDHAATSRNNTSLVAANPKASCSSASSPASGSSFSPSPNTSLMDDESTLEEQIQEGNDIEMQKGDDHENQKDIWIANEFMMSEDIFKGFQENGAAGVGDDLSCSLLSPPWTPSCSAATKGNFTGEGGG